MSIDVNKFEIVESAKQSKPLSENAIININNLLEQRRVFAECYEHHPDKDLMYQSILRCNNHIKNLLGL
jgi:hypothetical protein